MIMLTIVAMTDDKETSSHNDNACKQQLCLKKGYPPERASPHYNGSSPFGSIFYSYNGHRLGGIPCFQTDPHLILLAAYIPSYPTKHPRFVLVNFHSCSINQRFTVASNPDV